MSKKDLFKTVARVVFKASVIWSLLKPAICYSMVIYRAINSIYSEGEISNIEKRRIASELMDHDWNNFKSLLKSR